MITRGHRPLWWRRRNVIRTVLWALVVISGRSPSAADAPGEVAPVIKRLFPAGGSAGGVVVVKAEGEFPRWPLQVWTDRPGTAWKPLPEKGVFEVTIAAQESLSMHRVRVFDEIGAAALRRFVVGGEVETEEVEPNDRTTAAQLVSVLPSVINGALGKAGDVDCFAVSLDIDQTLVAALDAHGGVGSPVDGVLEIIDETGRYLARNLDARGLDPRVVFTARRAGPVIVRAYGFPSEPNQSIGLAGASDYVYRLLLSTGPVAVAATPAALTAAATTAVKPVGWSIPVAFPARDVMAPGDPGRTWIAFDGVAGAVEMPIVDAAVIQSVEASAAQAPVASAPVVISGLFDEPSREAAATIRVQDPKPLAVAIEAQSHGSEADPTLEIRGPGGDVVLTKSEREPRFSWTPPVSGDFRFLLRDRRGAAGPGHFFRVSVRPEQPELRATTEVDRVSGVVGSELPIAITIERVRGWQEPVAFMLVDPPPGISATPVISAADGDSAKKVTLMVKMTMAYAGPVRIVARPGAGDAAVTTVATVVAGKEQIPSVWLTARVPSHDAPTQPDHPAD